MKDAAPNWHGVSKSTWREGLVAALLRLFNRGGEAEQRERVFRLRATTRARRHNRRAAAFHRRNYLRIIRRGRGPRPFTFCEQFKLCAADVHIDGRTTRERIAACEGHLARHPGSRAIEHKQQNVTAFRAQQRGHRVSLWFLSETTRSSIPSDCFQRKRSNRCLRQRGSCSVSEQMRLLLQPPKRPPNLCA